MTGKFYVYAYLEPNGMPFYIGKGYDRRDTDHFRLCRYKETCNDCPDFYAKLRELLDASIKPKAIRLLDNLPLPDARIWEKFFIDALGRIDLGTGPLTNLTDGRKPGPKVKQRMSKSISAAKAAMTSEEKKRLSDNKRAFHANMTPEEKRHFSEAIKATCNRPEEKQRRSKTAKIVQNRPETKRLKSAAIKSACARPEEKQRRSRVMKARYAKPEDKQRQSRIQKEVQNRPEVKKRKSIAIKAALAIRKLRQTLNSLDYYRQKPKNPT